MYKKYHTFIKIIGLKPRLLRRNIFVGLLKIPVTKITSDFVKDTMSELTTVYQKIFNLVRGIRPQLPKGLWKGKKKRGRPIKISVPSFQQERCGWVVST
ncbi:MAG: hypothetical protein F6K18_06600 [Okeania sp. SIO2C2]|nr:hypothetical protein [Okeania sp. SIO2C2]